MAYYSTTTWIEEVADITPQQFGYLLSKRKTDEEGLALLDNVVRDYLLDYRGISSLGVDMKRHNNWRLNDQFKRLKCTTIVVTDGFYCFGCLLIDGVWKCYYAGDLLDNVPLAVCSKIFPRGVLHFCISRDGFNDDKVYEFDNR